jgi:Flp pilus assembly protein TadD
MSPKDAVAHVALSYVLIQPVTAPNLADRYEEAEKLARRALELSPANALAYDQLGVSMELRGFIGPETENAYRKAIQLDPAFAPPHAHLGRLLRRRGRNKEASVAYQNAVDRARDVGTKILVAEVLQSEQRYSESEILLREALKEDQRNPTALLLLARALITTSNYDEAENLLKKALSIGANGFMANNQLAGIYLRQGKPEFAEKALLQASRFVSELDRRSLSQSFEAVGDAFMKAGNNKDAERAFKQAIAFDAETDILSGKLSRAQQGRFSPGNSH